MFEQAAQVEDQAPLYGNATSVSGPIEGVAAARAFQPFQQGPDAGRDGNGVGALHPSFGAGEGNGAGKQVHQAEVEARFPQAAAGVVSDFKADRHPLLGRIHGCVMGKKAAHPQDFVVGEDGAFGDRRFFGSVVHQGHRGDQAQQSPLAVQPFDELHVVGRQVAAHGFAVGSRDGQAPRDVLLRVDGGKILQADAFLFEKAGYPAPGVAIVESSGLGDGVSFDEATHPQMVILAECLFFDRKSGGFLSGFCPVQRVVDPVTGGLGEPLSVRTFVPDPKPRTVFSFVNGSHVTIVSNHPKTQINKG